MNYIKVLIILMFMLLPAFEFSAQTLNVPENKKEDSKVKDYSISTADLYPFPETSIKFDNDFMIINNPRFRERMIKKPEAIRKLDIFLEKAIEQGAFPGCQVFASKNGQVIYQKNFGTLDKNIKNPVTDSTLYDIASITKIVATTLAIMKLHENEEINIAGYLRNYINIKGAKGQITLRELLLHEGGLKSWIPFYKNTIDPLTGAPRKDLFSIKKEPKISVPVAKNLYMRQSYIDTVWKEINNSPLQRGKYVYSDLDFYFLEKVIENVAGVKLDKYVDSVLYKPLGLKNMMYNPWKKGLERKCAPTEYDDYFRFQTIQGYVHDQGAAMMGGVAGHAGLFSNVNDIAIILQMLLNGGSYNGIQYFKKETIEMFTDYHSSISRRGLGFDKPDKKKNDGGPAADLTSKSAFGHQGFTGTAAWADPETGIIFIFLSNRVYPTANNRLINTLKIRTEAQQYIYEALGYEKR